MSIISTERKRLFLYYSSEFEKNYLLEPIGQKHLSLYKQERDAVNKYWKEIKKAKQEGKDITDLVLQKLLPYSNTRHNKEKNYRISVAPAVTKDIRKWFENAGWQSPENWKNVAIAIFDLTYKLVEEDNWAALKEFEENEAVSKGIKSGFLTPTFYFLNSKFRIINNKTIDTINFLLEKNAIGRDLKNYKKYLEIINNVISELEIPLFEDSDIFDSFCHWMCDKRLGGYARIEKSETVESPEDEILLDDEIEPTNHWEAIYYIIKIGNLLGYKTYVADPKRVAFNKKLGELATLSEVPRILKSAPEIHRIDAIWYKPTPPFFLFEVEDGGTMREALHRLYNAMAFDARFFVVCPLQNQSKFDKWVQTAPFRDFAERYNFRTYANLFDFYKEVLKFVSMRERFLKF